MAWLKRSIDYGAALHDQFSLPLRVMLQVTPTAGLLITTTVTIFLAFVGYLITYLNSLRLSQRKDRLDRVNRQLGEFYGPLYALAYAGTEAREKSLRKFAPGRVESFVEGVKYSEDAMRAWRHWIKTVFMPINVRIYEFILTKSDLLVEPSMPRYLKELCAHVASYKIVLEKWSDGDFSEHVALVDFPKDLHEYARKSFISLKAEQATLLGTLEKVKGPLVQPDR